MTDASPEEDIAAFVEEPLKSGKTGREGEKTWQKKGKDRPRPGNRKFIEKLISEQPNWKPMAYDPGDEHSFLDDERRAEVDAYVAEHDVSVFEALKELDLLWEQQEALQRRCHSPGLP